VQPATLRDRILWALLFLGGAVLLGLARVELGQAEARSILRGMLQVRQIHFSVLLVFWIGMLLLSGATRADEEDKWVDIGLYGVIGSLLTILPFILVMYLAGRRDGPVLLFFLFILSSAPAAVAQLVTRPLLAGRRASIASLHLAATAMLYGFLLLQFGWRSILSPTSLFNFWPWVVVALPYVATVAIGATKPFRVGGGGAAAMIFVLVWLPVALVQMPYRGVVKGAFWPVAVVIDYASGADRTMVRPE
jgi:hypothetical protein